MKAIGWTWLALALACSGACGGDGSDGDGQTGAADTDGAGDADAGTGQGSGTTGTTGSPGTTTGTPGTSTTGTGEGSTGEVPEASTGDEDAGGSTGDCETSPGAIGPQTLGAFVAGEPIEVAFTVSGEEGVGYVDWWFDGPDSVELDGGGRLSGSIAEPGIYPLEVWIQFKDPASLCTSVARSQAYDLEITPAP